MLTKFLSYAIVDVYKLDCSPKEPKIKKPTPTTRTALSWPMCYEFLQSKFEQDFSELDSYFKEVANENYHGNGMIRLDIEELRNEHFGDLSSNVEVVFEEFGPSKELWFWCDNEDAILFGKYSLSS